MIFVVVRDGNDWGFFFGAVVPIGNAQLDAVLARTARGLRRASDALSLSRATLPRLTCQLMAPEPVEGPHRGLLQLIAVLSLSKGSARIQARYPSTASSEITVIDSSHGAPKVVAIATSLASRPRPMSTRPLRRSLFRGSNVHQRSPR